MLRSPLLHLLTRINYIHSLLIFCAIIVLVIGGCRKDGFNSDPDTKLEFSQDTISFDTVFTTRGSITKSFRIFNSKSNSIRISSLKLEKISGDQYRMNVDGIPGTSFTDIEILPKDSIWVFVEVTIDPMDMDNPFVVDDRIEFVTNGNIQHVALRAWGQDAYYYTGVNICNETWTSDRPYVIVGTRNFPGLHVDTNCTLTILAGARIYLHDNAGIFVSGTLKVNGTKQDTVVFEGDRLESFFDDLPGQWIGLFFMRGSTANELEYAIINEADYGISAGSSFDASPTAFTNASRPDVILKNTIIKNCQVNAIFGFNADIETTNCLAFNTNDNLIALGLGGRYEFVNSTFVNTGTIVIDHRDPILLLGNAAEFPGVLVVNDLEQADFQNCIMFGSLEEEITLAEVDDADFNYSFESCLLTTMGDTFPEFAPNNLINMNPFFESIPDEDFHLTMTSPAIDAGTTPQIPLAIDLDGNARLSGSAVDIGAYEFQ